MKRVAIYTDGSCLRNPGPGGWAALLMYGDREQVLTGAEANTTNNRMELTAALEALEALPEPCKVDLHTDSAYLQKAFTNGWVQRWGRRGWTTASGTAVKNKDLWVRLMGVSRKHEVRWNKVKAHASNTLNNRVDRLARKACSRG